MKSTRAYATLLSTVLLLRTPLVTADLPAFQKLYYAYQKELWRRLMWTFPKWFYYRAGTLTEQRFRELNANPTYNNPQLQYADGRPDVRHQRDRRFKQVVKLPKAYDAEGDDKVDAALRKVVPNPRTTKADETNDLASLERKLARTLYLVISEDNGALWKFPTFPSHDKPLHLSAKEGIELLAGTSFHYFGVSNTPCHVRVSGDSRAFFMKLHILCGDFRMRAGVKHMWLAREEVGEYVGYYDEIEHLMSEV